MQQISEKQKCLVPSFILIDGLFFHLNTLELPRVILRPNITFNNRLRLGIIWDYSGVRLCNNVCDPTSQTPSQAQMSWDNKLLSNVETESDKRAVTGDLMSRPPAGLSLTALDFILSRDGQSCWLNIDCIHKVSILQTWKPNLESSREGIPNQQAWEKF